MIELSYVSLFSGIEAFSVAASRIEGVRWNPVFFSEIDPFPCAVLAHHFPQVPNLGDICKIRVDREKGVITNGTTTVALPGAGIDILAGGSPCQDCSIAGKRAGMAEGSGTRSSLAFEYARLVEELRPRIILWENVGGVLSSNRGLDFAAFLRSLVERGYSLAYRVLDAQYTVVDGFPRAVPQRRKRVWLVGCAGTDESVPAQILFERPGVLGDTPPRREAGQGFAAPPGYCVEGDDGVVGGAGFGETGQGFWQSGVQTLRADHQGVNWPSNVAVTPCGAGAGGDSGGRGDDAGEGAGTGGSLDVAAPLCAADGKGKNGMDICGRSPCRANTHANGHGVADEATHTLDRASGQAVCVGVDTYNQSISPNVMHTLHHHDGLDNQPKVCVEATGLTMTLDRFHQTGVEEVANTLRTSSAQGDNAPTVCIDAYNQSATEESCMTLRAAMTGTDGNDADPKVVVGIDGYNQSATGEVAKTLNSVKSDADHTPMVATMLKVRCGKDTYTKPDGSVGTAGKDPLASEESAFTLAATQDQSLVLRHIVRRLTPTECERLMALPDNYTRIPYRGKPADQCPDSPRYKGLGNSMSTNCVEWILRRIVAAVRLGMIGGQE